MTDPIKSYNCENLPQNHQQNNPKTYFDLIEIVGSHGKYQFNMFLIFCSVLFITATMLLNTSFLFLNQEFQCKKHGLLVENCQSHICSLQSNQWKKYLVDKEDGIKSAAAQFGPFVCDEQLYLDLSKSCVYFGSFVGLISFATISDNYGRKTALVLSMSFATLGSYIVSFSQNIIMLSLGLICSGAGINTASATVFLFFPQVVENSLRQKYSILIQVAYTFGGMTIVLLYFLIGNWKIISIISTTIPITIILFLIITYVQETPQFLLSKNSPNKKALKSLNRIGKINLKIDELISQENINSVKQNYIIQNLHKQKDNISISIQKKIVPLDLLRYSSLRSTTICVCCMSFITFSMYYGPIIIIDQIGFNIFVSSLVVQISQLITFLPSYYFIAKIKRQNAGIIVYLIASFCSIFLIFITKPENCDVCIQSIIELIVVFFFRFVIAFYLIIFLMYIVELFPSSASGIGNGFAQATGTIGSTLNPIILGQIKRLNINPMNLFAIYGIIGVGVASLLKQTQGKKINPQIQELSFKKQQKTDNAQE